MLLAVSCGSQAQAASANVAALQGAWVQGGACSEVFVAGKKGMTFKDPSDMFAQAFIITGTRLRTPGAVCRILSVSSSGDRMKLSLSCTTALATSPAATQLSVGQDGVLTRFSDSEDTVGSPYQRCGS